jgi:leader peptidase (prepilin peptidase)/N-methyltransferase
MPVLIAILGLAASLLINYLADVLPETYSFSKVKCKKCNHGYSLKEYMLFQNCSACKSRRSIRSYVFPFVMIFVFLGLSLFPPKTLDLIPTLLVTAYFSLVLIIDLERKEVLLNLSLVGAAIGLLIGTIYHGILTTLIGGAAGALIMLALYLLGKVFVKIMSKVKQQEIDEVALGMGDVYVSLIIGLFLGWPVILFGLLVAILAGGLISGLIILFSALRRSYSPFTAIPYTPFLILSTCVLLYVMK